MSNPHKIPRADAKLKRLSESVQARIWEMCQQPGFKQADVLKWIKDECDVRSSPASLSEFLSWYAARQEARQNEARVTAFLDQERNLHPELTTEQLFEMGQRAFSLLAIARQDNLEWVRVQRTGVLADMAGLNREKFEEMKRKAAQADAAKGLLENPELSEQQRAARMKQLFGLS